MRAPVPSLPELLRVLSDPTRLRSLALLEHSELSVGELCRALGMAQSRVSNHLRVLREHRLLVERHVGSSTYLRPALGRRNGTGTDAGAGVVERLWAALRDELEAVPDHAADLARLRAVLADRHASTGFFDSVAAEWDKFGVDFETGQARQRLVANLLAPGLVVADLGCGTGYLGRALLGLVAKLVCVDASEGMLEVAARSLAPSPPSTTVELRRGELDALPIADGELDAALFGMVLHHLPELDGPLAEARRAVRPGGVVCVLELAPHREAWMRDALGDRHLGLDSKDVVAALERTGFADVRLESVDDRYCPRAPAENGASNVDGPKRAELSLYLVRGRVPAEG